MRKLRAFRGSPRTSFMSSRKPRPWGRVATKDSTDCMFSVNSSASRVCSASATPEPLHDVDVRR